ncbi:hypothetical protein NDU88_005497 [Pleurodeles waltl]|uniref:Uncharacterized protein n=1 Tax=Pleurodeles waltl TaxID=8319 RepID=A0AAV7QJ07_PLEWA|nr:hypothetical protein NDU88_005497 [Pleurodeles waltl]
MATVAESLQPGFLDFRAILHKEASARVGSQRARPSVVIHVFRHTSALGNLVATQRRRLYASYELLRFLATETPGNA